jgi:archaellum component FlaC
MVRNTPSTWLGSLLGQLYSAETQAEKETWRKGIDNFIPDQWPLTILQDALFQIVNWVFDPKIERQWNMGVEAGDKSWNQTLGKFEEAKTTVTNYVNQQKAIIDKSIEDAKAKITTLNNDLNTVKTTLNTARNDLNNMISRMNEAQQLLSQHTANIKDIYNRLKELEGEARTNTPLLQQVLGRLGM